MCWNMLEENNAFIAFIPEGVLSEIGQELFTNVTMFTERESSRFERTFSCTLSLYLF